jgi:toxin ParE1/3/4
MRLSYTQEARRDLRSIYRSSVEKFGLAQADLYRDGLLAALAFCAETPQAVREFPDLRVAVRIHPYRSHLIVFMIVDDAVRVIRVLHSRQDLRRAL